MTIDADSQSAAEQVARRVYLETRQFYRDLAPRKDVGFEILLGPPYVRAPVLFLGYQPGYGKLDANQAREMGYEDSWPKEVEFITQDWLLAERVRAIFDEHLLTRSVALNAIFVRAKNMDEYDELFDRPTQRRVLDFCKPRVVGIIEAINPQKIVVIGLGTLALSDRSRKSLLRSENGLDLVVAGRVAERDAMAVAHLSGARGLYDVDRDRIREYLRGVCGSI